MALLTPLGLEDAVALCRQFGLEIVQIEALAAGSVNSNFRLGAANGDVFFARLYEEQEAAGAAAEAHLLHELAAASVPVVTPLQSKGGEVNEYRGKPFAIFPWVRGEDLCLGLITESRCRHLGVALARIHAATARLSVVPQGRFGVDGLRQRLTAVENEAPEYADDVGEISGSLERLLSVRDGTLPQGLTHGDLFRDNVLWDGPEISALLDFESACEGVFIYDVMVCILSWCYTSSFQVNNVQALVDGYESVRPLTPRERASAVNEGCMACVRFATTRLTDFELRKAPGKAPVRDFRRFMDRMVALKAGALDAVFGTQLQS